MVANGSAMKSVNCTSTTCVGREQARRRAASPRSSPSKMSCSYWVGGGGEGRRVARHLPEVGGERAHRGDDLERIAVGLDDDGVGVLGEERAEVPQVGGRLEQPALAHVPRLEVLRKRRCQR